MPITLTKAVWEDCPGIHAMQIQAFRSLLDKYQDCDFSPGAEKLERTQRRFREPITDFWLIQLDGQRIGAIRVCSFGELCKLKQIFVLPEYQGKGYGQEAIRQVEALYPQAARWELDTILQEAKLRHLYEKMGYRSTGRTQRIQEGMDLLFYAKQVRQPAPGQAGQRQ